MTAGDADRGQPWVAAMPFVFVVLWSTGFIGSKLGAPHAEPFTFLALRFAIVAGLMVLLAVFTGAHWPRGWTVTARIGLAGLFIHGVYLGGVFVAIDRGLPAGLTALIVGLQPIMTALVAGPLLGERVSATHWLGFALGFIGVVLVLWPALSFSIDDLSSLLAACAGLFGITLGTLMQKRYGSEMDLRSGGAIQFGVSACALSILALGLETREIEWTGAFIFALAWLVLVLSFGAITLLLLLIRLGAASRVTSLFFLVPFATAAIAWPVFGEALSGLAVLGFAVTAIGVALVNR